MYLILSLKSPRWVHSSRLTMVTRISRHGTPICPCAFLPSFEATVEQLMISVYSPVPPTLFTDPIGYLGSFFLDRISRERLAWTQRHNTIGIAYFREHATKPETIGFSLADSPVGLLAWIYEKLISWMDDYPWTDDEGTSLYGPLGSVGIRTKNHAVLEWISIYWFSRAGPSASTRIYYEMTSGGTRDSNVGVKWMSVPVGVSHFPAELVRMPLS